MENKKEILEKFEKLTEEQQKKLAYNVEYAVNLTSLCTCMAGTIKNAISLMMVKNDLGNNVKDKVISMVDSMDNTIAVLGNMIKDYEKKFFDENIKTEDKCSEDKCSECECSKVDECVTDGATETENS